MKTLVLAPYNYSDARIDLVLFNFAQNVYSHYFAFEGMYGRLARKGQTLEGEVATVLYLADKMLDSEYEKFDIFYGPMSKNYHFDRVIVYGYDIISAQEEAIASQVPNFKSKFYTSDDATERCANIMEAIKLAQSTTTTSNQ